MSLRTIFEDTYQQERSKPRDNALAGVISKTLKLLNSDDHFRADVMDADDFAFIFSVKTADGKEGYVGLSRDEANMLIDAADPEKAPQAFAERIVAKLAIKEATKEVNASYLQACKL